jgi:hypothetical protein
MSEKKPMRPSLMSVPPEASSVAPSMVRPLMNASSACAGAMKRDSAETAPAMGERNFKALLLKTDLSGSGYEATMTFL